jgi:hypothetical protein
MEARVVNLSNLNLFIFQYCFGKRQSLDQIQTIFGVPELIKTHFYDVLMGNADKVEARKNHTQIF